MFAIELLFSRFGRDGTGLLGLGDQLTRRFRLDAANFDFERWIRKIKRQAETRVVWHERCITSERHAFQLDLFARTSAGAYNYRRLPNSRIRLL